MMLHIFTCSSDQCNVNNFYLAMNAEVGGGDKQSAPQTSLSPRLKNTIEIGLGLQKYD